MNRLLSHAALAFACAVATPFASATVLTFDDIATDDVVAANYGGLDWSAGGWFAFAGEQAPFAAHSGDVRVTSSFGADDAATAIGFDDRTIFEGAWFAGYDDVDVTFELYDHGVRVATSSTLVTSGTPTWLASGYGGRVDQVIVSSANQGDWVLDDLTFSSAVPEPGSLALMAGGLLALAIARRRA